MADQTVSIALVGAGLIGKRHAMLLKQLQGFELAAIIDPTDDAKVFANDLSADHFDDLESYLSAGQPCDGVILATPNETHKSFALLCLEKGLPCLIEKPLAANGEDALAIYEASEKTGVRVLVGHHRRHHTVSAELKARLEQQAFGKLIGAQLTWMLKKPDDYFKQGKWRTQKGGGPVWINFIHEIDLLRYFLGEIVEVSAFMSNMGRGNGVEDSGVINMRCENGALVSAMVSDATPSPWHFEGGSGENPNICQTGHSGLRLFGTKAAVEFPTLDVWQHGSEEGHWGTPIYPSEAREHIELGSEVALSAQLKNFHAMITRNSEPLVSALDGLQSVRVVEAIHQSASSGAIVRVPSPISKLMPNRRYAHD